MIERRKLILLACVILGVLFGKESMLGALAPIVDALQIYMPADV